MGISKKRVVCETTRYDNYLPEISVRCLLSHMKIMAEKNAAWAGLMEKTYHSLADFCSKMEQEEE